MHVKRRHGNPYPTYEFSSATPQVNGSLPSTNHHTGYAAPAHPTWQHNQISHQATSGQSGGSYQSHSGHGAQQETTGKSGKTWGAGWNYLETSPTSSTVQQHQQQQPDLQQLPNISGFHPQDQSYQHTTQWDYSQQSVGAYPDGSYHEAAHQNYNQEQHVTYAQSHNSAADNDPSAQYLHPEQHSHSSRAGESIHYSQPEQLTLAQEENADWQASTGELVHQNDGYGGSDAGWPESWAETDSGAVGAFYNKGHLEDQGQHDYEFYNQQSSDRDVHRQYEGLHVNSIGADQVRRDQRFDNMQPDNMAPQQMHHHHQLTGSSSAAPDLVAYSQSNDFTPRSECETSHSDEAAYAVNAGSYPPDLVSAYGRIPTPETPVPEPEMEDVSLGSPQNSARNQPAKDGNSLLSLGARVANAAQLFVAGESVQQVSHELTDAPEAVVAQLAMSSVGSSRGMQRHVGGATEHSVSRKGIHKLDDVPHEDRYSHVDVVPKVQEPEPTPADFVPRHYEPEPVQSDWAWDVEPSAPSAPYLAPQQPAAAFAETFGQVKEETPPPEPQSRASQEQLHLREQLQQMNRPAEPPVGYVNLAFDEEDAQGQGAASGASMEKIEEEEPELPCTPHRDGGDKPLQPVVPPMSTAVKFGETPHFEQTTHLPSEHVAAPSVALDYANAEPNLTRNATRSSKVNAMHVHDSARPESPTLPPPVPNSAGPITDEVQHEYDLTLPQAREVKSHQPYAPPTIPVATIKQGTALLHNTEPRQEANSSNMAKDHSLQRGSQDVPPMRVDSALDSDAESTASQASRASNQGYGRMYKGGAYGGGNSDVQTRWKNYRDKYSSRLESLKKERQQRSDSPPVSLISPTGLPQLPSVVLAPPSHTSTAQNTPQPSPIIKTDMQRSTTLQPVRSGNARKNLNKSVEDGERKSTPLLMDVESPRFGDISAIAKEIDDSTSDENRMGKQQMRRSRTFEEQRSKPDDRGNVSKSDSYYDDRKPAKLRVGTKNSWDRRSQHSEPPEYDDDDDDFDNRRRHRPSSRSSVHSAYAYDTYDRDEYREGKPRPRSRASDREDYRYYRKSSFDERLRPRSTQGYPEELSDEDDREYRRRVDDWHYHNRNVRSSYRRPGQNHMREQWDYICQWFRQQYGRWPSQGEAYKFWLDAWNRKKMGPPAAAVAVSGFGLSDDRESLGGTASREPNLAGQDSERSFERHSEILSDSSANALHMRQVAKEPLPAQRAVPLTSKFAGAVGLLNVAAVRRGQHASVIELRYLRPCVTDPATVQCIEEMSNFPGPLIKPATHKSTLIQFCQRKASACERNPRMLDAESQTLIWKFIGLLLRQNGSVMGTDLAALLLEGTTEWSTTDGAAEPDVQRDHHVAVARLAQFARFSSEEEAYVEEEEGRRPSLTYDRTMVNCSTQTSDLITVRFRELLLAGHKKEALEHAMRCNLWGHALFLAMKTDPRTHVNVMTRFANSLSLNDPLQTLYQLMSERQPFAVTKIPDTQWGDWRPHLGMILANFDAQSQVDVSSVLAMGHTLATVGRLHAAHFCYLAAYVLSYCDIWSVNAPRRIALIGAEPREGSLEWISVESVQCTELFEYAVSLLTVDHFCLPPIQMYKFVHAVRLADFGFNEEAFRYCEVIARSIMKDPAWYTPAFCHQVYTLGLRLQRFDPTHTIVAQGQEQYVAPAWLDNLWSVAEALRQGTVTAYPQQQLPIMDQPFPAEPNLTYAQAAGAIANQPLHVDAVPEDAFAEGTSVGPRSPLGRKASNVSAHRSRSSSVISERSAAAAAPPGGFVSRIPAEFDPSDSFNSAALSGQRSRQTSHCEEDAPHSFVGGAMVQPHHPPPPSNRERRRSAQLSGELLQGMRGPTVQPAPPQNDYFGMMTAGSASKQSTAPTAMQTNYPTSPDVYATPTVNFTSPGNDSVFQSGSEESTPVVRPGNKLQDRKQPQRNSSFLGSVGDWMGKKVREKLLPRGPNEVHLPDDTKPAIVWDDQRKKWINTADDEEEPEVKGPPPTMTDLMKIQPAAFTPNASTTHDATSDPSNSAAGPPTLVARANLARAKAGRSRYADPFAAGTSQGIVTADSHGSMPPSLPSPGATNHTLGPKFFMPEPVQPSDDAASPFSVSSEPASADKNHPAEDDNQPRFYDPTKFAGQHNAPVSRKPKYPH